MKSLKFLTIISLVFSIYWVSSCNPKKGNTLGRAYRNFTSFFNGYYHARIKYKEGTAKTEKNFKVPEDGSFLVLGIPSLEEAKSGFADFDEVVKKCDVIIFKHRKKKDQEPLVDWIFKYNNWVDDARILIGKAWFTKQNYVLAQQNFAYVLAAFPKSKNRPEAYLWLAKTQLANDNAIAAKQTLDKLFKEETNIHPKIQAEAQKIYAMLSIYDKDLDKAIIALEDALLYQKGKKEKAKIHYLLGQLYDSKGAYPQAIENFQKVVRINSSNQMVFNSLVNINKINVKYLPEGSDMSEQAKAFKKLAKDVKYEEFKDQIYYELAMLELKQKNKEKAIEYLKISTQSSKSNTSQKALSYYALGKIYFEDKNFKFAQSYYDTASTTVTSKSPYYDEIKTVSAVLKDYVKYLNTIHRNDSLLALSKLSEEQLNQYVDNLIEQDKKKKEIQEKQQQATAGNMDYMKDINTPNAAGFYFDNQQIVASGKTEFRRFWGDRKNEDNWRRSNKEQTFESNSDTEIQNTNSTDMNDPKKAREAYLKNIPKTDSAKIVFYKQIQEAYFELGQIYAYKFNVPDSAITQWKTLIQRFPNCDYAPKAAYSLYTFLNKSNNTTEANYYKNFITQNFPNSDYDKLIRGEKIQESNALPQDFIDAYNGVVGSYNNQQYQVTINMSNHLLKTYPTNSFTPKLYYMKAMSYGYLGQKDSLKNGLQLLVKNYPDDPASANAKKTLALMEGKDPNANNMNNNNANNNNSFDPQNNPNDEKTIAFNKDVKPKEQIYVIFFIEQKKVNLNELKVEISNFNKANFSEANLNSLVFSYQGTHHLGQVQTFQTLKDADKYIKLIQSEEKFKVWLGDNPNQSICFMTMSNFRLAYGQKKMQDYFDFYIKNREEMLKN